MNDPAPRMRELVETINQASYQYYVLDRPLMPDAQWDALYDELTALEKKTGIRLPDSPTRRVGGAPLPAFVRHRHLERLWSMDKAQSEEALHAWFDRVRALHQKTPGLPPLSFTVEYKYDGLTINLTYRDGLLIQAATRGDGVTGEQVLSQAMTIKGVPLSVPYRGLFEIHGECIMRLSVLSEFNRTAEEPLKNARNGAAGALRNLDPAVTASRKLDARFYSVGAMSNPPFDSQQSLVDFIKEQGFPVSPVLFAGSDEQDILEAVRRVERERESLDFLIDGAVIKVNDFQTREALGYTDKFPRWAVAFKFAAEEMIATLLDVTWEPGRTGRLTPSGHLSPVDFGGVTVKRATLNNYTDIKRKGLTVGSTVWVRRSNDVIPEILGKVEDGIRGEEIKEPAICPACGSALAEIGANLFCLNRDGCKPQVIARLAHFCSRSAMNIEQLSDKTLEVLSTHLGVTQPQDLYALTRDQLISLPGFQEKKADNLLDMLRVSRDCELDAFLVAIGIPNIGRATARDLALAFNTLQGVQEATAEQLTNIPSIGPVIAASIAGFFSDPDNQRMIRELLLAGVTPREMADQPQTGPLQGRFIVLTGTLPTLTRQEAEELIVKNGGTVSSSVSRKTSYLLLGESPGSKLQKAQALGIPLLSEPDLLSLIKKG